MSENSTPRKVRTTEGARFFGVPIGTEIGNRFDPDTKATQRATSLTRLISLQRQFLAAKATGNLSQMRDIQETFTIAVKDYVSTSGQLTDVLDALVASRGRADKDIKDAGGDPVAKPSLNVESAPENPTETTPKE